MTGTSVNSTTPSVTFAFVTNNELQTIDVVIPADPVIYHVDPVETTELDFRRSFYALGANGVFSNTLSYFDPTTTTITDIKIINTLKNLLSLGPGGIDDGSGNQLPIKQITINGVTKPFDLLKIITDEIVAASEQPYNTWSTSSQINLNRKIAQVSSLSSIVTTTLNTNALTWTELERIAHLTLFNYLTEKPNDGEQYEINFNFVIVFTYTVNTTGDSITTKVSTLKTEIMLQFKVKNWTYKTVSN
jgi:hypothetical protein